MAAAMEVDEAAAPLLPPPQLPLDLDTHFVSPTTTITVLCISLGVKVEDPALSEEVRLALRGAGLTNVERIRARFRSDIDSIFTNAGIGRFFVDDLERALRYSLIDDFKFSIEDTVGNGPVKEKTRREATTMSFEEFGANFPPGFNPKECIKTLPIMVKDALPDSKLKPMDGKAVGKITNAIAAFLLIKCARMPPPPTLARARTSPMRRARERAHTQTLECIVRVDPISHSCVCVCLQGTWPSTGVAGARARSCRTR